MRSPVLHLVTLAGTMLLGTRAVGTWRQTLELEGMPTRQSTVTGNVLRSMASDDSLKAWEAAADERDPYRLSGDHPDVAGDATPPAGAPALPGRSVRPALHLKAIVGGPPWQAVLSGVPGQVDDLIVQAGQEYGGLLIKRVSRDAVMIQGADTAWTLTMMNGRGTP